MTFPPPLSVRAHLAVNVEICWLVLGAAAQEGWQPISRTCMAAVENVLDLAILQVFQRIRANPYVSRIQPDLFPFCRAGELLP